MIGNFSDQRLKRLFERGDRCRLPPEMAEKIEDVLGVPSVALSIDYIDLPGYRLHQLRGDLAGFWSVTIRANCMAFDVAFIDYH